MGERVKHHLELTLRIDDIGQPARGVGKRSDIPAVHDERPISSPLAGQAHVHDSGIEEALSLLAMAGPCGHRHPLVGIDAIDLLDQVHRVA